MEDKTGGAAFPASGHPDMQFVAQEGMSLRDYLAAKAMNGILANNAMTKRLNGLRKTHIKWQMQC